MSESAAALQARLCRGWQTWNTRSVLSHVWMPHGLSIDLGLHEFRNGQVLRDAFVGRTGAHDEVVHPGPHADDGSYTDLNLKWRDIELRVQTATDGDDWVALVTPLAMQVKPANLIAQASVQWNRRGHVRRQGDLLRLVSDDAQTAVWIAGNQTEDPMVYAEGPYLAACLDGPAGLSTGRPRTLAEIEDVVDRARARLAARSRRFGDQAELFEAMQTCLAWDTVYDPIHQRVVSPVSRLWNMGHGGWVLFCWDTYFAAMMAAVDAPDLAMSNALAITAEHTEAGFVPNYAYATGQRSRDRSQPPVGAIACREVYRHAGERWFLEEVFDDLLAWNRWWPAARQIEPGVLAWGSDPIDVRFGNPWETQGVNERFGASLESGLDNSPMYDGIEFDPDRHMLKLGDAGLTGLYVADCEALADIAKVLGRSEEAELRDRAGQFAAGLDRLWDDERGLWMNRHEGGGYSERRSPTNFYPMISGRPSSAKAERAVAEHLLNPKEFWGDYVLPSISRDDPGYPDNEYWRGRIWAPMNFLVYLGLRRCQVREAATGLADRSAALLLQEWRAEGHVHENYNAETGDGDDVASSDKLYHWGALLALIALMEHGHVPGPEAPLPFGS